MQILDASQDGEHKVQVGIPFRIELDEIPTSGYRWHVESTPELAQRLEDAYQPHADSAVGGGGKRSFVMQIDHPRIHTLVFRLHQPWADPSSAVKKHIMIINPQP